MATIKVIIDGVFKEVSKQELFDLAEKGNIGPETPIQAGGKQTMAGKVKGIVFGMPEPFDFSSDVFSMSAPAFAPPPPAPKSEPDFDVLSSIGSMPLMTASGEELYRCSQCDNQVTKGTIQCVCGKVFDWNGESRQNQAPQSPPPKKAKPKTPEAALPWYSKPQILYGGMLLLVLFLGGYFVVE